MKPSMTEASAREKLNTFLKRPMDEETYKLVNEHYFAITPLFSRTLAAPFMEQDSIPTEQLACTHAINQGKRAIAPALRSMLDRPEDDIDDRRVIVLTKLYRAFAKSVQNELVPPPSRAR